MAHLRVNALVATVVNLSTQSCSWHPGARPFHLTLLLLWVRYQQVTPVSTTYLVQCLLAATMSTGSTNNSSINNLRALGIHTKLVLHLSPCEEDCAICQDQFRTADNQIKILRYKRNHTDIEAKEIIARYVRSIQADQEYLRARQESHGNMILGRWKKKSRDKRRACILQVCSCL